MSTDQNISIRIADVAPFRLTIKRETEYAVREAERGVNEVWSKWRNKFEDRNSKEILAMVAYQYAKLYFQQLHFNETLMKQVGEFESELDGLLELVPESDTDLGNS